MRVLFWSRFGDGTPVVWRAALDGHEVVFFPGKARGVFEKVEGVEVINGLEKILEETDRAGLVVFDMVGLGRVADRLRSSGKFVVGAGKIADKLELDRLFAMKVFDKLGVGADYKGFRSYEAAADWVEKNGGRWVFKPLGNQATSHTYVAEDPNSQDLVQFVRSWAKKESGPCVIQEFVNGEEVSTEGWFDGEKWIEPFNHTLEKKRLMEGDKGPQTGGMGNLVWLCSGKDLVVKKVLKPLTSLLRGRYVGPIDVNCIVTENRVVGLEFTCRFGYPAIQALLELLWSDAVGQMKLLAARKLKRFKVRGDLYAGAVRLSLPPWPHSTVGVKDLAGVSPLTVPKAAWKHFHPADVRSISPSGEIEMAGVDGVIGEVSSRGNTVREVRRRAYRSIDNWLRSRDVQWRADIFSGLQERLERLRSYGLEVPVND